MDELCEVTGYHRKAAIRLLRGSPPARDRPARRRGRPVRYGTRTVEVLVAIWTAAGLPWSARLKALRPAWRPWARPGSECINDQWSRDCQRDGMQCIRGRP